MRLSLKLGKVMNRNENGEWERSVREGNRNGKWKQGMERGRETANGNGEWAQAMGTGMLTGNSSFSVPNSVLARNERAYDVPKSST